MSRLAQQIPNICRKYINLFMEVINLIIPPFMTIKISHYSKYWQIFPSPGWRQIVFSISWPGLEVWVKYLVGFGIQTEQYSIILCGSVWICGKISEMFLVINNLTPFTIPTVGVDRALLSCLTISFFIWFPGLKDQLNLLAEAFHKYEIAEVRWWDVVRQDWPEPDYYIPPWPHWPH